MAKNIREIPYTEIIERIKKLGRSSRNTDEKIRGIAQDVYLRDITSKYDWNFLITDSSLTTVERFNTGTCSINTQGGTITFSSDVTITSGMIGRKIKIDNNSTVYNITGMSGSTGTTINPTFEGTTNAVNNGYEIFQDEYALAHNFDRFPKDGGLFKWTGGRKEVKPEWAFQEQLESFQPNTSVPRNCRLVGMNSGGNQLVELNPPPSKRLNYGYSYFRMPAPLMETTAGTLSNIDAAGTVVTGNTNTRFTEANTGDWFRVDALGVGQDSQWYRIIAIAHDSSLTLQTAFANTAITSSANYSISSAPDLPPRLHPAVLYGSLIGLTVDQNDPNAEFYRFQYASALSDSKRIYVSRVYSQEVEGVYEDWNYRR